MPKIPDFALPQTEKTFVTTTPVTTTATTTTSSTWSWAIWIIVGFLVLIVIIVIIWALYKAFTAPTTTPGAPIPMQTVQPTPAPLPPAAPTVVNECGQFVGNAYRGPGGQLVVPGAVSTLRPPVQQFVAPTPVPGVVNVTNVPGAAGFPPGTYVTTEQVAPVANPVMGGFPQCR